MPSIQINKKNHEKLCAIRDEEGLKSFNNVIDKILPAGSISTVDFEIEKPAFTLISNNDQVKNISWEDLKKAELGTRWSNDETATVIYKEEDGCLIKFQDDRGEVYLNYFHFLE